MKIHFVNGKVIYPDRVEPGFVTVEGSVILETGAGICHVSKEDKVYDLEGLYLSPGFVEIHSHGAGGCDFMDGTAEAVIQAAKTHLRPPPCFPPPWRPAGRRFWEASTLCALQGALWPAGRSCRDSTWRGLIST